MTKKLLLSLSTGVAVLISSAASASMTWTDPSGDQATGNHNLDMVGATMSNDLINLSITIEVAELSADWGKYMLFMDTGAPGHTGNHNPWSRNVDHGGNSISHFTGIWLDNNGGAELFAANPGGNSWDSVASHSISIDWAGNSFTVVMALNDLGVGIGDTIYFDASSTGGNPGDPSTDHFSDGHHGSWGEGSSLGHDLLEYNIVPAPATLALLGLTGIFARRRRA